ncbi:MAG TPA: hypothetical protein VKB46_07295 [Pyrinomonadaceae bacterium]|nr:hypothetical protein [Pyrinomonadaceae bacterium]
MTEQIDIGSLTRRLCRLEREMRWWRTSVAITLLVVAILLSTQQATTAPAVVEAQKLILRDPYNKVRAVLGTSDSGCRPKTTGSEQYGLHFCDSDGVYRAGISEFGDGQSWEVQLQAKRTPSAAYVVVNDGIASLELNATEQTREVADKKWAEWAEKFNAARSPEEREKLLIDRKIDAVRAALSAFPKGTSSLTLKHGLGGGLDFYLLRRQSSLYLKDENGTTRAVLGHTEIERPATGVVEQLPISSFVLFNKDAKVVWKAP